MPPTKPVNVLLIGSGAREHALAIAIARSPKLGALYATGTSNPGIASLASPVTVPTDIKQIYRLNQFCDANKISLVVIGPEDPLAEGYADALASPGRLVFGPSASAARIESDKAWSKKLMRAASIPTAEGRAFTDPDAAVQYLESREESQVIKAAGLAKGKGVILPDSLEEGLDAIDRIMRRREFGDAGKTLIIEERLQGREVSVLAITDGASILVLPPCQDHKRLRDNDEGPNTGGMGAFCPADTIDDDTMSRIETDILIPTLDALRREEIDYRGVLYAGLILTPAGPKVLEFNCRFGDPECQPLMSRLESDAIDLLSAPANDTLDQLDVRWSDKAAVCVVLASEGYPEKPRTGVPIDGVEAAEAMSGVSVYHGATKAVGGQLLTDGGRVLSVTALGDTLADARDLAYAAADKITFKGKTYRTDVAAHVTQRCHG
ncbi:MAG: phosphoribosylamine--glycine ligase [Phycisphaerales bacterium]